MDIHILAQGIVYFCMFIAGLAMSITIGVNRVSFTVFTLFYPRASVLYIHFWGPPRGIPVPLFPAKKRPCSPKQNLDFLIKQTHQKKICFVGWHVGLDFLCSLFPKIACVPLIPLCLGLCSPAPLKKKYPWSPVPQNPWEGLIFNNPNKFMVIMHGLTKGDLFTESNLCPHYPHGNKTFRPQDVSPLVVSPLVVSPPIP